MCKGKSFVLTKGEVYYSRESNSHEDIKKEHRLKDTTLSQLCIVELYPRGKHLLSTERADWEIKFENTPLWLLDDLEYYKDKVYRVLFEDILPDWKAHGIKGLFNLFDLGYKAMPDWDGVSIQCLDCSFNQLTTLTIPKGIQSLSCSCNKLTTLIVPRGIQDLSCNNNRLTTLTVLKGIQDLNCSDNQLTELTVSEGIKYLYCSYNQLTTLTVPRDIKTLYCNHNRLTELTVPKSIRTLFCHHNPGLKVIRK